MKITLLRHGKPNLPCHGKLSASELGRWIDSYNCAGITNDHISSKALIELAASSNMVVCSDLRRSIDSAAYLGIETPHYKDALFREAGLPYARWPTPKLSPNTWAALFRALWLCGFSANGESFAAAKMRGTAAASSLSEHARNHGRVLLVGHGFINRFIADALLHEGWRGPKRPASNYWGYSVYETSSPDGA